MGKKKFNRAYRLTVTEDETHLQLLSYRVTRLCMVLPAIPSFVVIVVPLYALIAFTPLRTTIPGYPDPHFRREAVNNAIKIDSLEAAITRWKLYSENLSRVLSGDTTINLDSLLVARDTLSTK